MKKTLFVLLAGLFVLVSCNKNNGPDNIDLSGEWHLESFYSLDAEKADIDVYISFEKEDGNFAIYQKLGGGHYTEYKGTYSTSGNVATGKYSDGTAWACDYDVTIDGNTMTLVTKGLSEEETCIYVRTAIPSEVKQDAWDYAGTKSVNSPGMYIL